MRTLTYAPELAGAPRLAAHAGARGVVPCIGHTDSDARTARAALAAAARSTLGRAAATHLFNGMPVLHSRAPGPVAAALAAAARGEAVVELVADGVHLAPDTVAAVFDLVGPGQIALVTDAMPAAGMSSGRYRLGRLDVEVSDGVAHLRAKVRRSPASIAGGTARLVDVLRRTVRDAGVGLLAAVTAATATPARLLGLQEITGALRPGLRADLFVVDDEPVSGARHVGRPVGPRGHHVIVTVTPIRRSTRPTGCPHWVPERSIAFAVCSCASAERASTLPEGSSSSESAGAAVGLVGDRTTERLVEGPSTTAITDSDSFEARRTLPVVPRPMRNLGHVGRPVQGDGCPVRRRPVRRRPVRRRPVRRRPAGA